MEKLAETPSLEQVKKELKECGISLKSNKTYYRWIHPQLGPVYDSLDTFYNFFDSSVNHNDYFSITPALDLR